MIALKRLHIALAITLGFCCTNSALAETSDWMSGKDIFGYADQLKSMGLIVTKMECKDSGQIDLDVGSAIARVHYTQNTNATDWKIDGWNNLAENKSYWSSRGFKLASYTTFTRAKSGLRLYCMVYNK